MTLSLPRFSGIMPASFVALFAAVITLPTSALPIIYTNSDVVVAGRATQTFSLFSTGVFDATDDFTATGTLVITPANGVNFNPLFLITDGNAFFGGELNDIQNNTNTDFLLSANRGTSINTAAASGGTFANVFANVSDVATPVTIEFEVKNESSVTTSTVTFGSNSGSVTGVAPGLTLDPSLGLSLALANLESGFDVTFNSIDISIIPEPVAGMMLAGLTLACLGRRRSA